MRKWHSGHNGKMICWLQVHVDQWKVEVQEGERAQDLLKQQQDAPHPTTAARCPPEFLTKPSGYWLQQPSHEQHSNVSNPQNMTAGISTPSTPNGIGTKSSTEGHERHIFAMKSSNACKTGVPSPNKSNMAAVSRFLPALLVLVCKVVHLGS